MHCGIVNYFIALSFNNGSPYCFKSPITINSKVALELLKKQYKGQSIKGPLLHVCFDTSSGIIYLLNKKDFSLDQYESLIIVAKYRIVKDYGSFRNICIINGSPYSSFRIRTIKDFPFASKIIQDPIPIIEVNLDRMPSIQLNNFSGGYVDKNMSFVDEIDNEGKQRQSPVFLWNQKAPFVLINTSKSNNPSSVEKERIVLNAHRQYYLNQGHSISDIDSHIDLYTIRSNLCLGWSFEEMSSALLRDVQDFGELITKIQRLMIAVNSLVSDGYKNVSENEYYISFQFDSSFPLKLSNVMDYCKMAVKDEFQIEGFKIVDINVNTGFITIKTPCFISPRVCMEVLKAKSKVYIYQYNPVINKIDIKTEICDNLNQHNKMKSFIIEDNFKNNSSQVDVKFRNNASSRGEWAINPNVFNIRKVSDFLYCHNLIMTQCEKNNISFKDLDVIIGPIEKIMGAGSQGGFIGEQNIKGNESKFPLKIEDDIMMMPPAILINSVTEPSCVQQMSTLLHEYRHYVYSITNRYHQSKYGNFNDKKGDNYLKQWYNYLTDDNEREAHMEEIRFELLIGKNEDEIIRDKVGGEITLNNYPIAIKFKELVDKVIASKEEK